MAQYWVCQSCKSLNRAGASRCYSCKANFGSTPAPVAPVNPEPPRPVPLPAVQLLVHAHQGLQRLVAIAGRRKGLHFLHHLLHVRRRRGWGPPRGGAGRRLTCELLLRLRCLFLHVAQRLVVLRDGGLELGALMLQLGDGCV